MILLLTWILSGIICAELYYASVAKTMYNIFLEGGHQLKPKYKEKFKEIVEGFFDEQIVHYKHLYFLGFLSSLFILRWLFVVVRKDELMKKSICLIFRVPKIK